MLAKNKIIAIAITMILTISAAASMSSTLFASAHDPAWKIPTYAYITVSPDPVGVGQKVDVLIWLDKVFPDAGIANDYRFHNFNLTITKPDGKIETKIFETVTDSTSSQYYAYTPDQTGNYTFTFNFPGQAVNTYSHSAASEYVNDTYTASSASTTLTVQEEAIPSAIDSYPLPTEYWTRPIYGENPYWYVISSNWLGSGTPGYAGISGAKYDVYSGDSVGSLTNHIMWTKSMQAGGVVGGDNTYTPGNTYFEGSAYINRYINPIIVNGKIFYTEVVGYGGASGAMAMGTSASYGPTVCVDLETGELLWSRSDVPALSFALIYDKEDENQHGVMQPILVATSGGFRGGSTSWKMYDADTGNHLANVTNIPSGTKALGPNGEILIYTLTNYGTTANPNYYLAQWNSSKLATYGYSFGILSGNYDASTANRYDWNVSIPSLTNGGTITNAFAGSTLICYNGSLPGMGGMGSSQSSAPYTYFAINLNSTKGPVGSISWMNTVNAPAGNITVAAGIADPTANGGAGGFVESYKETTQWVGYSMATGAKLWTTNGQTAMDYYGNPQMPQIGAAAAYGKLYSAGYGGIVYCYDLSTGKILWTYGNGNEAGNTTKTGMNLAYPNYPTIIVAMGNDVVYTVTSEHTVSTPLYKGALARAINATTGAEIWTISSYTGSFGASAYAMADGYNTWFNGYTNEIYTVGKGPSQTTVSAPNLAAASGQGVYISGTVTDIASGTTQEEQAARFPNGVPVASDASMSDWMGYVYQQKPKPTNFTGVDVTISVIDANGNYRTIGTATTDESGYYSLAWTPDIPGKYTVIATFAGTNGYWGSNAKTGFTVDEPVATATPQPTQPPSAADLYFLPMSIAIIIAVVVIGAVLALLLLRKHP
jgi:hypothetical protein